MRLLNAKTLDLVDVRDDAVPKYAILSHTWGNDEITIQDLRQMKSRVPQPLHRQKRTIASKEGFAKVKRAAQLAVQRGLSYIWVDTCCIDKTSSAELSEAINSMYLWYQQSEECYAFLSDVWPSKTEDWAIPNSSLQRSRWFSRGWTLQELIAPKTVQFYAKDWSFIGEKHSPVSFMSVISQVTGIDEEVLNGRIDPLHLSVSARMAWAAHRHTTRLEDTAYSLMGLFQVNMPLLYGEGQRAFTRLQEEIIQRTDDQSLFAWNINDESEEEDPDALFGMLAKSPAQFRDAGRIQALPPLPIYASAPSSMTNHGLRIQLYLRAANDGGDMSMEEDYYAILDCFMRVGDAYKCPVLRLRRLSEDQYARLQPRSQKFLPPPGQQFAQEYEGYRAIYVRQQPVYYHLPQFRVSPLHMLTSPDASDGVQYKWMESFPPQQWNSTTMTLKANYSRKLRAMGVFRFQSVNRRDESVDVVVGLRRLNAMEWEGWCFQRSCRGKTLEATFTEINGKIEGMTSTKSTDISSRRLRDFLGDDSSLTSNATVEGMQLQGRLYISVLLSPTSEIQTGKALNSMPTGLDEMASLRVLTHEHRLRMLTGKCYQSIWDEMDFPPGEDFRSYMVPVRANPHVDAKIDIPNNQYMDTLTSQFMKPLYDFLAQVRGNQVDIESEEVREANEFAVALFDGDLVKLEPILAKEPNLDVHTSDKYGFSPLHWAAAGGSAETVRLLLENGANILITTKDGLTASHVSALCNTSVWSAFTKRYGEDTGLRDLADIRTRKFSESPLHLAAAFSAHNQYGQSFFRQFMEEHQDLIPLSARNRYDETPLHRAAANNNTAAIEAISKRYSNYCLDPADMWGRLPSWHAAAAGSCDAIESLLSLGANIEMADDLGRSPLHAACRGGHLDVVILLLEKGLSQDTETAIMGFTPMDYAAMFGHVRCLKELLNVGVNLRLGDTPSALPVRHKALHIAASCGWLECVQVLCESGANPYIPMSYYIKLEEYKEYATMVHVQGDAQNAASKEGHEDILRYFDTAEACKEHRLFKQPAVEEIPKPLPQDASQPLPQRSSAAPVSAPTPGYGPPSTTPYSRPLMAPTQSYADYYPAPVTEMVTPGPERSGYSYFEPGGKSSHSAAAGPGQYGGTYEPQDYSMPSKVSYVSPAQNSGSYEPQEYYKPVSYEPLKSGLASHSRQSQYYQPAPSMPYSSDQSVPPQQQQQSYQSTTLPARASSTPHQQSSSSYAAQSAASPFPARPYNS